MPAKVYYNNTIVEGDPFFAQVKEPIDYGDRWGMTEVITLNGVLKDLPGHQNQTTIFNEPVLTSAYALTDIFKENFKELRVEENGVEYFKYDSVMVDSIDFPSDKWMKDGWIRYTVKLKSYDIFSQDKVIDPSDSISYTENEDGTVDVSHKVSAKGLKVDDGNSPLQNAMDFVNTVAGIRQGGAFPYFLPNRTPIFLGGTENVNRAEGIYSITENYKYQVDADPDQEYIKLDKITRDDGVSNEYGMISYQADYQTHVKAENIFTAAGTVDQNAGFANLNEDRMAYLRTIINNEDYCKAIGTRLRGWGEVPTAGVNEFFWDRDIFQVSLSIDEHQEASKISVKGTFRTGYGVKLEGNSGFEEYVVTFSRNEIDQQNTYSVDGELKTFGGLTTKNNMITDFKNAASPYTAGSTKHQDIEYYLAKQVMESELYGIYQYDGGGKNGGGNLVHELNPYATRMRWSENPDKGTLKYSASFNDDDSWLGVQSLKYNVSTDSSTFKHNLVPSANVEGVYLVQDLKCQTKSNTTFKMDATSYYGQYNVARQAIQNVLANLNVAYLSEFPAFPALGAVEGADTSESQTLSHANSPHSVSLTRTRMHDTTFPQQIILNNIGNGTRGSMAMITRRFTRRGGKKFGF